MSVHLIPLLPVWLVVLLACALFAMLAHGSVLLRRREVPRKSIITLALLRTAVIVLFVLILLQPVVSYTRTVQKRQEMLVMIDVSESMAEPGGVDGRTRLQEVTRRLDDGLASELSRRFELRWFAFDRGATILEGKEWATLQPQGSGTHYADSLTQAWSYLPASASGARSTPERVLLVSDGHDRGNPDLVEVARRYGVAIDVLAPGSTTKPEGPSPIVIADVQAARRVLLGSDTHFLVTLNTDRAASDRKVKLRLAEGEKALETVEVTIRAGRTEERVRLTHRPGEVGTKRYEFRIDSAPLFPVNVQVVDGKHEVLVLEDTWRWEFKFLRRVLEDDPSFRYTAILSRGGGAFQQFAAPDRRSQLVGVPQEYAQLHQFDTVIVGDINPRRWPRDFAASLRRLVMEDGKSLVVVAGPNLSQWTDTPELLSLLPVEVSRDTGNPVMGPVQVRVSAEGSRSPFLTPLDGMTGALPSLDQVYPPLRKKPAATILLEAEKLGNAAGPLIVMAEHTVGRGRVLYVGSDTLWKWQTLATAADPAATPYHRFWQQSLRALAPVRPGGSAVNLWLQPNRSRYEAGQRAVVRAEVDATVALPQASVKGIVSLPDGRALPLNFAPDSATPNAYLAEFETGKAGAYRVTAAISTGGRMVAEASTTIEVDKARGERDGGAVNRANLARIAAATGGKMIDPADSATWPTSSTETVAVKEHVTLDLWNRSYLLILLALVAGTDWLLRLLRGYV